MSESQQPEKSTQEVKPKYVFGAYPLYEHKTPEFREKQGYEYYAYGDDNTYPDYLVYLYNRSTVHNAVIDGKVRFILGSGWVTEDQALKQFMMSVNPSETLDELSQKIILDRRIFGGYALRVVWAMGKIVSLYHVPFQKIRVSAPCDKYPTTKYIVSNEWSRNDSTKAKFKATKRTPEDAKEYEPFNPVNKTGEQILYVVDYRPQTSIYPLPEYHPCNAAIETDVEIDNFHLNNIKTGFAAGTMITLFNGKPDPEEQMAFERKLKAKVAGTDNGGETVINYAEVNETPVKIDHLRSNDLDKQYEQLARDTRDKIFIGHGVTSPMLFGVKTEGQLGGRNEMDLAWQLLNINYVEPKRKQFEAEFNYIFQVGGYSPSASIKPMNGLGIDFSEATIVSALSKDEIREIATKMVGIDNKAQPKVDDILTTLNSISPLVANKILNSLTTNQILQMIGLPAVPDGDKIPQDSPQQPANFDSILINKFSQLGIEDEGFEFAEDDYKDEQKLLDYLKGKKKIDINKATQELDIDVEKLLNRLIEKNVVVANVTANDVQIEKIQNIEEPTFDIKTFYKYAWVDPSKADDIDNSRDFCRKLIQLNRLYTREEIDGLNNEMKDFNTDVWKYRGGWMTVPNTNGLVHKPSCRHFWKQVLVKVKR